MVYGQGLVDAEAAISPVGDVDIPLPAGGIMKPRDGFIGGGELPEEMLERLRRERIIVLDELNAPFAARLAVKPDKFQSFGLTQWMTHGDNKTAPYSHPTLAVLPNYSMVRLWARIGSLCRSPCAIIH